MRETYVGPSALVFLGRQGENEANRVHFPLAPFEGREPGGYFVLIHQREGDLNAYPCVIEEANGEVLWLIKSADVASPGKGYAELQYYSGEQIWKSIKYQTQCVSSLEPSEDVPEPYESWVAEVASYADRAEAAVTHYPYIGENANWYVWDAEAEEFVDTGIKAEGVDGDDGVSVVSVDINASHHLICTLSDGTVIDAGEIQGGGGGTGDHTELTNRDAADQHPMSAITGLVAALQSYRTAQAQDLIDQILASDISGINAKVSSQASSSNKLVSASEMGDAISSVEAKQLYATASQGSFATKAALTSASTFYNADGTVATPTKNDVAYVLADESHSGKSAKYVIASVSGSSITWGFVITFSDTAFTQAQMDAINSGITSAAKGGYDAHVANGDIHVTAAKKTAWDAKYSKPASGIPAADIADGVIPSSTEATGIPIVTSVSAASTDSQVPTAKAVYDAVSAAGVAIITEESSMDTATLHNNETVLFNGNQASIYADLDTPESGKDFLTGCIFKAQSGQYFEDIAPNGYSVVWDSVPTWTAGKVYEIIYRCLWIEDSNSDVIISAKWSEV